MWNNQQSSGAPAFPSAPGFPAANAGYNPGYAPSYGQQPQSGYGAPPGAPPSGYGPPPGAPPSGYPPPSGGPPGFPGASHTPGYGAPPGPPPGQAAPHAPQAPYGGGGYGAPPGPPPVDRNSYPGQQWHQQGHQQGHQGHSPAPPTGPPSGHGYGGYGAPQGPPPQQGAGYHPPRPPTEQQRYGPQMQGAHHQVQQPFFQYSQCNGKKKALCIGINYVGQQGQLRGCINDVNNIVRFLTSHYGYKKEDIVTLTDDAPNPRQKPTKQNILQAMEWLVRGARPNDSLFFHYSGHGGQTKDADGDEGDGFDEVIYPVDFQKAGHIVDDQMHHIMVKPLPAGCRLTAIFDSCHSGSALDLPYIYSTEGKVKEPNLAAEAGQGLLSAVTSYAKGDMGGVFKSAMGLVKTATGNTQKAEKYAKATRTSPADVISWSGCKDSQTSADAQEAGQATGAMSYAFVQALSRNKEQSYQQLLGSIREILRAKYSQKPQLSSSHPMDTNILFIC